MARHELEFRLKIGAIQQLAFSEIRLQLKGSMQRTRCSQHDVNNSEWISHIMPCRQTAVAALV